MLPTARLYSSLERFCMTKAPACLTSTRNSVCSPCLADTVTVSTTSRRSLPMGCTLVFRSSEICGFHWPLVRGPSGASKEQSLRYTPCRARDEEEVAVPPAAAPVGSGADSLLMIQFLTVTCRYASAGSIHRAAARRVDRPHPAHKGHPSR